MRASGLQFIRMSLETIFQQRFGRAANHRVKSPGRVNLIGEHTDYNDGFVLPTPIRQQCIVLLEPRADQRVCVYSLQKDQQLEYNLGQETAGRDWLDYVQAITEVLRQDGHAIVGFDAVVSSDVPLGSGLSSSAAMLVAFCKGLRQMFGLTFDDVEVAKIAQRAENGLVGARVGLMDQMACSLGRDGAALMIDFKTMEFRSVPLPDTTELVVLHSGVTHSLAGGEHGGRNYKTRRAECEKACELLGVSSLRDLTVQDLPRINALSMLYAARARHVVTENARVLEAVAALESGDLARVGELFYASHASMRDDYDVSEPEIDLIVELSRGREGIYGARLTGGGFGGSVVMLAQKGKGRAAGEAIALEYATKTGKVPKLLSPPND
jgi:galactokinase